MDVALSFSEVLQGYADSVSARAAWFVEAQDAPEALVKLGLIGPGDRLVVSVGDALCMKARLAKLFRAESLAFAAGFTPDAYVCATADEADAPASISDPVTSAPASSEAPLPSEPMSVADDLAVPHASYASGAGASFERLFWLVSAFGGRGLHVADIRAFVQAAHEAGAILIVDATAPTHFGCDALALGAHIVMESLEPAAGGACPRGCIALGVARSKRGRGRKERTDALAEDAYLMLAQRLGGARPEAWQGEPCVLEALAAGLAQLSPRMQARFDAARALACYLEAHPAVDAVCYPGLKSHPDHTIAASSLSHGFGPLVDFKLPAGCTSAGLLACAGALGRAEAAGGSATRLSPVFGDESRWVRLCAGLDDPIDIVDSLDQAMRLYCNPPQP